MFVLHQWKPKAKKAWKTSVNQRDGEVKTCYFFVIFTSDLCDSSLNFRQRFCQTWAQLLVPLNMCQQLDLVHLLTLHTLNANKLMWTAVMINITFLSPVLPFTSTWCVQGPQFRLFRSQRKIQLFFFLFSAEVNRGPCGRQGVKPPMQGAASYRVNRKDD